MRDLTVRLAALDPEAGAAIRVVSYFDELSAGHAGLHAVVRGAAALTGCAAGLVDPRRNVRVRVDVTGRDEHEFGSAPDPAWLRQTVDGEAFLWLERPGPARVVDAVVLERACALARDVLERTRPLRPALPDSRHDPAWLEVLLDAGADPSSRRTAAEALGFTVTERVRVVVPEGPSVLVVPEGPAAVSAPDGARAGVGPAVPVVDAPASYAAARRALRLTAAGTAADPGPRVVQAQDVPALLLLADVVRPGVRPNADVEALERCAAAGPALLQTLHALTLAPTWRAAAADLGLHHSTLQKRLAAAQRILGWDLREPSGVQRLHLALVVRRLHRNPV